MRSGRKKGRSRRADTVLKWAILVGLGIVLLSRPIISGRTYLGSNPVFQLAILLLTILWIIRCAIGRRIVFHSPLLSALIGMFLLVCFVGFFFSVNQAQTWRQICEVSSYVLLFLVVTANLDTKRAFYALIAIMIAACTLVSVYGMYQRVRGLEETRKFVASHPELATNPDFMERLASNRIFSTFVSPSALAGFLIVMIPIVVGRLGVHFREASQQADSISGFKRHRFPLLLLLCLVLSILALVLAYSRSGWVSLLFGLGVFFSVSLFLWTKKEPGTEPDAQGTSPGRARGRRFWIAVAACSVAVGIMTAVGFFYLSPSAEVYRYYLTQFFLHPGTMIARFSYWRASLSIVRDYPILGTGLGTFANAYPKYMVMGGYEVKAAHNDYLQILAETGTLGLLTFVGMWVGIFAVCRKSFRSLHRLNSTRLMKVALFAGICSFLFHICFDYDFTVPGTAVYIFVCMGLISVPVEQEEKSVARSIPFSPAGAVIVLPALILLGAAMTKPLLGDQYFKLARACVERGELKNSRSSINTAIALYDYDARYHILLGQVYEQMAPNSLANLELALEEYGKAIQRDRLSPFHYHARATAYWKRGKLTKNRADYVLALGDLRAAVACFPVKPRFHRSLGKALKAVGYGREGEAELLKALELEKYQH